jgi:hypothetical protein
VGHFLHRRPSSALTLTHSLMRSQPVTARVPQKPPPGAHPSGSFSPFPSPAPADPHRRCHSGQTVTRASGQGCLMLLRRIPSLLAANCRPSCPLVLLCTAAPLSHAAARRCCACRNAVAKHLPPRDPHNTP